MQPIFITGIGTGIGKTIVSAIVTEALEADYWKPIQAGFEDGTDALQVSKLISNPFSTIHKEAYKLAMPASPHIASRAEKIDITTKSIALQMPKLNNNPFVANKPLSSGLVVEGAGGIMVPINNEEFIIDLIEALQARVILVSRNYLGSINHSLLTASICKARNIDVIGWVFNDQYLDYENEIVAWTGYPRIASIPFCESVNRDFVSEQAQIIRKDLLELLLA